VGVANGLCEVRVVAGLRHVEDSVKELTIEGTDIEVPGGLQVKLEGGGGEIRAGEGEKGDYIDRPPLPILRICSMKSASFDTMTTRKLPLREAMLQVPANHSCS
jgi:hypothetical protein